MVSLRLEIPQKMRDVAKEPGIENRPYDICFACPFNCDTCAGANENAVDMPRLVDLWSRLAKIHGITRADAAEESNIPLATVNSVMSKRTLDPRHSTVTALSKVYNRRTGVKPPCHIAALLMQDKLPEGTEPDEGERINALKAEIAQLKENEKTVFDRAERNAQQQVDHLKRLADRQEDRILKQERQMTKLWRAFSIASGVACVLVLLVLAAIAIDYMNHNIGFFWLA